MSEIANDDMLPADGSHDLEIASAPISAINHGDGTCYRISSCAYGSSTQEKATSWLGRRSVGPKGKGVGAPLAFNCIKAFGGSVPCTVIGVQRIYPVLYRERLTGGGFIVRSERMEESIVELYNQRRSAVAEGIMSEFHSTCDNSNNDNTSEGAKILKMLETAAEPEVLMAEMSLEQLTSFATYKAKLEVLEEWRNSLLDILSGFILWFTANAMRKPDHFRYPIGKHRMQPVGILVFASVMATLGLQILLESGRQLMNKTSHYIEKTEEMWMIGIMVIVTVVKFVLMVYCRRFKNEIVRAYAQDHFFDVITNSVGLVAAVLAVRYHWWIDPTGAIVIALYTINTWTKTVIENVEALIGRSVPPEFIGKLTSFCSYRF